MPTCSPESGKPPWHGCCRAGSESMQASDGKPGCASPRRASASRAPGEAGARKLAWGRQPQAASLSRRLRIAAAAAGLSDGELAAWSCVRACMSIRLRSSAGTACAPTPCTQGWSRTTLRCSRPRRCGSKPRSITAGPGADPRCTLGTAGPCRGNPVHQALPGPGAVTRSGIAYRNLAVDEALKRGAKPAPACAMVQTPAHLPQWQRRLAQTTTCRQRRPLLEHPPPSWRYSAECRSELVALCNSPVYQDLTAHEDSRDQLDPTAVISVHRARSKHPPRARPDRAARPHPPTLASPPAGRLC